MPKGHIISAEKDRYELALDGEEEGETLFAKARGVFREKALRPMIGDYVEWERGEQDPEATIVRIFPRRNQLLRPPVSNVDQVLVVQTLVEPEMNAVALDRLLVVLEKRGLPVVLCLNKIDLPEVERLEEVEHRYQLAGYSVLKVNALTGEGMSILQEALSGKLTAVAGPSGAGKSTLIRRLSGATHIVVGELSGKTSRGRQTTRTSRLFQIAPGSYIFDTPGFSSLDLRDIDDVFDLAQKFPEIARVSGQCRFRNCTHRKEPGCAVKASLDSGAMDPLRYSSYLTLLDQIEARKGY